MKQVIDMRPLYHPREDRIRAHVTLCWLALLLARVAENAASRTWPDLRRELDRIRVGTFTGPPAPFSSAPSSPDPSAKTSKPSKSTPHHASTS